MAAITGGNRQLAIWNYETGDHLASIELSLRAYDCAISPQGKFVACSGFSEPSNHQQIVVFDLETGEKVLDTIPERDSTSYSLPCLRFQSETELMVFSGQMQLRTYDLIKNTQSEPMTLLPTGAEKLEDVPKRNINRVRFSRSGDRLFVCGNYGIDVFDTVTGKQIAYATLPNYSMLVTALSHDESHLFVSAYNTSPQPGSKEETWENVIGWFDIENKQWRSLKEKPKTFFFYITMFIEVFNGRYALIQFEGSEDCFLFDVASWNRLAAIRNPDARLDRPLYWIEKSKLLIQTDQSARIKVWKISERDR